MTAISVRVDDRLRLAGSLLAAGSWPELEQARKPYRPHRVADGARWGLAHLRAHPAVVAAQDLAGSAPGGASALFGQALSGQWSATLAGPVADFAASANLDNYWQVTGSDWRAAESDLQTLLSGFAPAAGLGAFLAGWFGALPLTLAVYPNLLFPGRDAVACSAAGELVLCQPPPQAWGSSVPWHYRERPDEVLGALAEGFARAGLSQLPAGDRAGLSPAAVEALPLAAAVLFLRQAGGPGAADQFMLVEQRLRGLPQLSAIVHALDGRHGWPEISAALRAGAP